VKDDPNIFSTRFFGIFVVIFVGSFFSFARNDPTLAIFFSAIAGSIFALVQRNQDARPAGEMPTLGIIIRDYRFRSFSAIGFLSIFYAILQGVWFGVASGYFVYALRCAINFQPSYVVFINSSSQFSAIASCAMLSLLSLIMVGVFRVFIETYILVFKVAQKYLSSN